MPEVSLNPGGNSAIGDTFWPCLDLDSNCLVDTGNGRVKTVEKLGFGRILHHFREAPNHSDRYTLNETRTSAYESTHQIKTNSHMRTNRAPKLAAGRTV